jgi:DNA-binding NarL/FixJ family response regulator
LLQEKASDGISVGNYRAIYFLHRAWIVRAPEDLPELLAEISRFISTLTETEQKVFKAFGTGLSLERLAPLLLMSVSTLDTHNSHIADKLKADERLFEALEKRRLSTNSRYVAILWHVYGPKNERVSVSKSGPVASLFDQSTDLSWIPSPLRHGGRFDPSVALLERLGVVAMNDLGGTFNGGANPRTEISPEEVPSLEVLSSEQKKMVEIFATGKIAQEVVLKKNAKASARRAEALWGRAKAKLGLAQFDQRVRGAPSGPIRRLGQYRAIYLLHRFGLVREPQPLEPLVSHLGRLLNSLLAKEREVFEAFGTGFSVGEVAKLLSMENSTVETHLIAITKKIRRNGSLLEALEKQGLSTQHRFLAILWEVYGRNSELPSPPAGRILFSLASDLVLSVFAQNPMAFATGALVFVVPLLLKAGSIVAWTQKMRIERLLPMHRALLRAA